MKKDRILREYYGTQRPSFAGGPGAGSNFYSGKDLGTHSIGSLGTRGADSNYSRRMQALVPNDYYDLLEDDEENIDEDIVVENSKYSLVRILELNENIAMDAAELGVEAGSDLAAAAASEVTLGVSSCLLVLKNIYEIKVGRDKADEIIKSHFIPNPTEKSVDKLSEILEDLIDDIIDLLQRGIECSPDPAGEFVSFLGGLAIKAGKFLKLTKLTGAASLVMKRKALRRMAFYSIIAPLLKNTLKFMNSESAPKEVIKNRSVILGTIQRIVLLGDIIEDFYIQKTVAEELGIPEEDFVYKHRVFKSGENIDDYDYEKPRSAVPIEERVEEERERQRAEQQESPEYSESNRMPNNSTDNRSRSFEKEESQESPENRSSGSSSSEFLRKLFVSKPGDTGLFSESLKNKSLSYLIEDKDSVLDEDLEEEVSEIEEFSGAGAVAIGTLPLGASTKGSKGAHSSTSGGKSFPYSKKNRKEFSRYTRKTFGGK